MKENADLKIMKINLNNQSLRHKLIIKLLLLLFIFLIFIIFFYFINYFKENFKFNKLSQFEIEIQSTFYKTGKVNLNEIEFKNMNGRLFPFKTNIKSIIHIGFTLDPGYILKTMITVSSIISTQYKTTKTVLHFGVVGNFTAKDMLKIYELRSKINNSTEFNFYYLKESIEKMKYFHPNGVACPGKFELPELLPESVNRLIIFDAGDVLILRDLSNFFNYNMNNYWVLGTPEPSGLNVIKKYNLTKYINIGSILIDVKEAKKNKIWDTYVKNRNLIKNNYTRPDQTLYNIIIPDNRKNFFPFKFGGLVPFENDKYSDNLNFVPYGYDKWFNSSLSNSLPEHPRNTIKYSAQIYNPVFIHQFSGKWHLGKGLSIFRNLAKYFIIIAGIYDEICKKIPGYCK